MNLEERTKRCYGSGEEAREEMRWGCCFEEEERKDYEVRTYRIEIWTSVPDS
jgi:hypothetical protein